MLLRLLLLVSSLALQPAAAQDALPPAVLQALAGAQLSADALAAVALPVGHDGTAWQHRATVPMQPASTMKLLTTIVALDRLGPNLRGSTELRSAAPLLHGVLRGPLALVGGADPELGVAQFWALLLELRAAGVRRIEGDLIVDRTLFRPARSDVGLAPFDEAPEFAYNVIPDALQLAGNLLPLRLASDARRVRAATVPALPGVVIDARQLALNERPCHDWDADWKPADVTHRGARTHITLHGAYPKNCTQRVQLQLIDRTELAERLFRALWQQLGGSWHGRVREGAAPADARTLARRSSRPWGEVLRAMNKTSDNPLTRLLFLQLGVAQMAGEAQAPTAELAAREVRAWFAEHGLADDGLVLDNGSGLSRSERITPLQLASMLRVAAAGRWAPELEMSLPVAGIDGGLRRLKDSPAAGWARLKTGTLRNVAALAGYVLDPQGRRWAVAMMINDERAAAARPALDALVDHIARVGLGR